jgi:hypothetical protein
VREQMRRSAAYVQDAISRLGTDEMLRKVAPPPVRSHQTLHGFVQRWIAQSRIQAVFAFRGQCSVLP